MDLSRPLVLALALSHCPSVAAVSLGQQPPALSGAVLQGVREVSARDGVPITSLLTASDVELRVVEPYLVGATSGPPPGQGVLEVMTRASRLVALVRVSLITSHLTADRTWIDADVTLSPINVLKSVGTKQTTPLRVTVRGGDLIVGRQLVRAMRAGVSQMRQGETYLIFMEHTDSRAVLEPINVFHVAGDTLRPLVDNPVFGELPKTAEALAQVARVARPEDAR